MEYCKKFLKYWLLPYCAGTMVIFKGIPFVQAESCPETPPADSIDPDTGLRPSKVPDWDQLFANDDAISVEPIIGLQLDFSPDIRVTSLKVSNNAWLFFQQTLPIPASYNGTAANKIIFEYFAKIAKLLPSSLGTGGGLKIIGMDVDTRAVGTVFITKPLCWNQGGKLVVTWDQVGYFKAMSDPISTFQIVLFKGNRDGDAIIEYRFHTFPFSYGQQGNTTEPPPFSGIFANGRIFFELPVSQQEWVSEIDTYNNGIWIIELKNHTFTLQLNDKLRCQHTEEPQLVTSYTLPERIHELPDQPTTFTSELNDQTSERIQLPFAIRAGDKSFFNTLRVSSAGFVQFAPEDNPQLGSPVFVSAYQNTAVIPESTLVTFGYKDATTFIAHWRQDLGNGSSNAFSIRLLGQQEKSRTLVIFDYELLQPVNNHSQGGTYPFAGITAGHSTVMELPYSGTEEAHHMQRDYRGLWEVSLDASGYRLLLPRHLACHYQSGSSENDGSSGNDETSECPGHSGSMAANRLYPILLAPVALALYYTYQGK